MLLLLQNVLKCDTGGDWAEYISSMSGRSVGRRRRSRSGGEGGADTQIQIQIQVAVAMTMPGSVDGPAK